MKYSPNVHEVVECVLRFAQEYSASTLAEEERICEHLVEWVRRLVKHHDDVHSLLGHCLEGIHLKRAT